MRKGQRARRRAKAKGYRYEHATDGRAGHSLCAHREARTAEPHQAQSVCVCVCGGGGGTKIRCTRHQRVGSASTARCSPATPSSSCCAVARGSASSSGASAHCTHKRAHAAHTKAAGEGNEESSRGGIGGHDWPESDGVQLRLRQCALARQPLRRPRRSAHARFTARVRHKDRCARCMLCVVCAVVGFRAGAPTRKPGRAGLAHVDFVGADEQLAGENLQARRRTHWSANPMASHQGGLEARRSCWRSATLGMLHSMSTCGSWALAATAVSQLWPKRALTERHPTSRVPFS